MEKYLNDMLSRYPELTGTVPALRELLDDLVKLFKNSGTFFVAGNGGSGADAEHICEFQVFDDIYRSDSRARAPFRLLQ